LDKYRELFEATVELVFNTLGETAFHLWRRRATGWSWYSRNTTVLYDPIMFVFSQSLNRADDLVARSQLIRDRLPKFYEDNYESFEGRYTNLSNISERNDLFRSFIDDALATPL
jgi:hypothetical protein